MLERLEFALVAAGVAGGYIALIAWGIGQLL